MFQNEQYLLIMNTTFKKILILFTFLLFVLPAFSQGFLRCEGQQIVNDNGPFIIRSIGTGNWMIQEGYMMQSTSAGIHTHTQFRNKLNHTIGVERCNQFYDYWLREHFTKTDLDSMKAWGFNAVRPALHYKWFTLPIEEEQVQDNGTLSNTWVEKGFIMLDELVSWCEQNQMYVIFDMHGAPGGQGKNADISDYDHNLPSLWESEANKEKLIALWIKLAERYKDSKWVGGYDIINETNWDVDGNTGHENGCNCQQNKALWDLQLRLTEAIRELDQKHIIYISGNCWGNNYKGFEEHNLKGFDKNTALTFHKYWNVNDYNSIKWVLDMRKRLNMPIWMSEGGENSNHWFAEAVELFEKNNIGWSWWPVKKSRLNNILKVTTNDDYYKLIDSWKEGNTPLSGDETYEAVMSYAKAHKISNCTIAPDVIYALNSRTNSQATKAYNVNHSDEWIAFVNYDLGKDGFAYHDMLSENSTGNSGNAKWNSGNQYRNDGVDIGFDGINYYVGWTEPGEWLHYSFNALEEGQYHLEVISSSDLIDTEIEIHINGTQLETIQLPLTNGKHNWETTKSKTFTISQNGVKLKVLINSGGANLKSFRLKKI